MFQPPALMAQSNPRFRSVATNICHGFQGATRPLPSTSPGRVGRLGWQQSASRSLHLTATVPPAAAWPRPTPQRRHPHPPRRPTRMFRWRSSWPCKRTPHFVGHSRCPCGAAGCWSPAVKSGCGRRGWAGGTILLPIVPQDWWNWRSASTDQTINKPGYHQGGTPLAGNGR